MKFLEISEKMPMVVEIIDESEKIEKFIEIILPYFEKIKNGCKITAEKASIILNKKGVKQV